MGALIYSNSLKAQSWLKPRQHWHILVKKRNWRSICSSSSKNGADFGKLAKKHSICPSGKRGGDLGEFRQGQMVPAFDKVVFSCPELEPTGPLHTQFGYHIIKVLYRK
ncbi:peptidyl-prolyl cis-trans isomerase ppiC [Klebsiella pneumoniae]|uniref:Peptidyl-prolyl cis-trans isomerase C n=1 Tax=Klebsiella pneumoniae TaxID=573 RepID=A0A2X3CKA4_KLEPN|nr:peptidyl-prolyl cis-trans isomerase ppiC [Klebsiella pneumoniae]